MADNTTLNNGTGGDIVASDDIAGVKFQRVKLVHGIDGINAGDVATTNGLPVGLVAGSAIVGKVGIDQTTPGTTNKVAISDSLGNTVSAFPATFLRTTDEPHQLFYDAFDATLDTTDRWTSTSGSSGVAAANSLGVMSMGTGTIANGYAKLTSQPTFTLPIPAWLGVSDAIALPDGAAPVANSYRYWGTGTTPATPTVAAPVTDGYGFELNTDGKLRAVVYAGGTRTIIQDLSISGNNTQPLDAAYHRYIVYIRTDKAYFYIDGLSSAQLVATTNFQSSQVQALPRLFLAIGNATPPVSNVQIQSSGATAWDTGKNNIQISDGVFQWRKVTVKAASTASIATDLPMVVAHHPSSPTPTGTNLIGKVGIDQTTPGTTNAASISHIGATVVSTGNGVSGLGVQRTVAAREQTYRASTIIPLVVAVTVNVPFLNIIGSASKTVTVKKITISGATQTAVGYFPINVEKLSTASTLGTSTTLVATTHDTNNTAVTAVVKAYTVGGTKGALVGTIASRRILWQATVATASVPDNYDFKFADTTGSGGIVLRGVAQELALTFPVALATAGTLAVDIEWTEE